MTEPGAEPGDADPAAAAPRPRRVLLKLSGEALMGGEEFGVAPAALRRIAGDVHRVRQAGVQVCVVVGGGNIFRGLAGAAAGIDRATGDSMGMLATAINALALQSALEGLGAAVRVMSAVPMQAICEPFVRRRAVRHMEKGRVAICAGGTGNPFFTTDTAAALRAAELGCGMLLKGTQVDGVYSADPKTDANAVRFDRVSYDRVLRDDLKVMDGPAISLARDNGIPIAVFSIHNPGAFAAAVSGAGRYTLIDRAE